MVMQTPFQLSRKSSLDISPVSSSIWELDGSSGISSHHTMTKISYNSMMTLEKPKLFYLQNKARKKAGLRRLTWSWGMYLDVQDHAEKMASTRTLSHDGRMAKEVLQIFPNARSWGENVGMGSSQWQVFRAFMDSSPHRANILNRKFNKVAIGIKKRDGILYICVRFVQTA